MAGVGRRSRRLQQVDTPLQGTSGQTRVGSKRRARRRSPTANEDDFARDPDLDDVEDVDSDDGDDSMDSKEANGRHAFYNGDKNGKKASRSRKKAKNVTSPWDAENVNNRSRVAPVWRPRLSQPSALTIGDVSSSKPNHIGNLGASPSLPFSSRQPWSKGLSSEITTQVIGAHEEDEVNFPELQGQYKITAKIGQGTFSVVYQAACNRTNRLVALKRIFPTSRPARLLKEVKFLHQLEGKHHVVPLLAGHCKDGQVCLVLEYMEHRPFRDYKDDLNAKQVQAYMMALLEALRHTHNHGIIHRDIKPSNFLYNEKENKFMLVDYGLAQRVPEKPPRKAARAGTRGFRAPEVLLKHNDQTTAIDMWSAGVILLTILTRRYPFFPSPDDVTSLCEIAALVGSQPLVEAADALNKDLALPQDYPVVPWQELVHGLNPDVEWPDSVFSLLDGLLKPNPMERITADEALEQPFLTE